MPLLRCTKKALIEFGLPTNETYSVSPDVAQATNTWYVNMFRYARRKCLIFTHEHSIFTVIIVGVTKRDTARLRELFRSEAARQLRYEGIADEAVERFLAEMGRLVYAKTDSRRVLGTMNDQVSMFKAHCDYRGGYGVCDFEYENKLVNEAPYHRGAAREVVWPWKEMKLLLGDTENEG